ncbi:MAG TPA: hypothetical protein VHP36_07755 [Chitinispirillaceae bacterium]|nr:hypothetical protein [Chitinispirillaceae bacterium]
MYIPGDTAVPSSLARLNIESGKTADPINKRNQASCDMRIARFRLNIIVACPCSTYPLNKLKPYTFSSRIIKKIELYTIPPQIPKAYSVSMELSLERADRQLLAKLPSQIKRRCPGN